MFFRLVNVKKVHIFLKARSKVELINLFIDLGGQWAPHI